MSRRDERKANPFDLPTADIDEVADGIFGKSDPSPLNTGVMRARPIEIMTIRPDRAQPRRAIPMVVQLEWDGRPEAIPELLRHWYEASVHQYGKHFDVEAILLGRDSLEMDAIPKVKEYEELVNAGEAEDVSPPETALVADFNKLLNLAASIHNEGLTNPITVVRRGQGWMIETGERRYLAHHLLSAYVDAEKYARIPAREVEFDIYRQASENNNRDGLNAIQMARQIALLIMAEREGMDGTSYQSIDEMVYPGECDRKFYAQVANGNVHRIPSGSGDKMANALGMSMNRISHYRKLLAPTDDDSLNDKIWLEADANNWTENYIRTFTTVKVAERDERLTTVNHPEPEDEPEQTAEGYSWGSEELASPAQPTSGSGGLDPVTRRELKDEYLHKRVRLRGGKQGIVVNVETRGLRVKLDDGATILVDERVVESKIYLPGEADPGTRRVINPPNHNLRSLIGKTIYVRGNAFVVDDVQANGMINTHSVPGRVGHSFTQDVISLTPPPDTIDRVPTEAQSNALSSEHLVQKLGASQLISQLRLIAGVVGEDGCVHYLNNLLKLGSYDLKRMSENMSKDEFLAHVKRRLTSVQLMLETVQSEFVAFCDGWDELDDDLRID